LRTSAHTRRWPALVSICCVQRWLRILLVVVVPVAVGLLVRLALRRPPVAVVAFAAERGVVERAIANSRAGTVLARRRAELSTGTSGIVRELLVGRGDRVSAGDVLLRLEDDSQRAALLLAQREEAVARAALARTNLAAERARREYGRNLELKGSSVSADRLDALESTLAVAEAEAEVAGAEVERTCAAVAAARAELARTVLSAPFDAIVAEVECELGEWVTPSVPLVRAPPLIDAIDPSSLYVSAPMDEIDSAVLASGLPVRVTLDPWPEREFAGRIARVAPYVFDLEQQNRTLEVEVELADADFSATLLPGTTADVEVLPEVVEDVLRVPTLALLQGNRVLVVEEGRLASRELTLCHRSWKWVEVQDGLREGELVVTSLERAGVEAGAAVVVEREDQQAR